MEAHRTYHLYQVKILPLTNNCNVMYTFEIQIDLMMQMWNNLSWETSKFTSEGCCSWWVMSLTFNSQQPSSDDSTLNVYQMSLTLQLSFVTNFSEKLVTAVVRFDISLKPSQANNASRHPTQGRAMPQGRLCQFFKHL